MALVFCDGFEQYSTTVHFSNVGNLGQFVAPPGSGGYGWVGAAGSTVIADSTVFRTTQTGTSKSLRVSSSGIFGKIPAPGTLIVGFGFRISSLTANATIATFSSDVSSTADLGLRIRVLTTGALNFYNELTNTSIASSAAGTIAINTWYHLEFKIVFGLVGSVQARVNEVSVCSASLVDTLCGAATTSIFHLMNSASSTAYFDDLYMCDQAGGNNNDYLGAVRIFSLFPTANGVTNDFAVTGAANNSAALSSQTPDFTSYTSSSVSGAKDLLEVQNLPSSPTTVFGVQVAGRVQDQGSSSMGTRQLGIRTAAVELFGSAQRATAGSWVNIRQVFENQADGITAWDEAAINNLQVGIKNS